MYIHGEVLITKTPIINYDPPQNTLLFMHQFLFFIDLIFSLQIIILTSSIEYELLNPHEVFVAKDLFSAQFVLTLAAAMPGAWTCAFSMIFLRTGGHIIVKSKYTEWKGSGRFV